ncbi:DNA repair protein RadA [Helcococcus kunzii]|uniref:DNA repair protein RadA n=1 Tax=Helcococcus kunzii TaxID=40091 RepID=UPI0021A3D32F|nr:DNA repair protein RadA [Helcococcus kunzii]MCT1796328.1 DNA repair protein RadA [Helcococcus kunzii]MCT1988998.1 DNA repair protein RadA [Helcococcus kunzii]
MKLKTIYRCTECGAEHIAWAGKCSSCGSWNTLVEEVVEKNPKSKSQTLNRVSKKSNRLKSVSSDTSERILTGINEFDRTIGGGIVQDSVSILTAKPGAGKSTLLLEISYNLAKSGKKILYISGEESESQIKNRANRIMDDIPEDIYIISTNSMDLAIEEIKDINPDVIFLDSIQTLALSEYSQRPGTPTQTIECANAIVDICKDSNNPKAAILVGHMTKSGEMAGLMTLEHLVDTVLVLENQDDTQLRVLRTTKNRFGYTGEIGLFDMVESGLKEVLNPSEYFITPRQKPVEGSALAVIKEGSRILTVEVESLVSPSFTPYPIRIGDSLRKDQLNTLISILEQRAGFSLYDKNVILKTTGGLKLSEQAVNLAIIMSIVSSLKKIGIDNHTVFIAEVGLTGELKRVPDIEKRLLELDRLGFTKAYIAKGNYDLSKLQNLEVKQLYNINEVIKDVFR